MSPAITGPAETYLIAEYDALRREIEIEIRELGEFLRYGLLASGGIWAWLLSRTAHVITVAYYLPLVVSVILFIETRLVLKNLMLVGAYLQNVERHFQLPHALGWEKHLQATRRKGHWIEHWETIVWVGLCIANLICALIVPHV